MGDSVDQEMAMSQQHKEIATKASCQAHFIMWTIIMGIPEPCGLTLDTKELLGYIIVSPIWSELHRQGWYTICDPGQLHQSLLGPLHSLWVLFPSQSIQPK